MKSLEDLSANYDLTVRNSSEGVVQMKFGDDGLDPVDMEGSAKPVNFDRTYMHAVTTTWDNTERGLLPEEIKAIVSKKLNAERVKHVIKPNLVQRPLIYVERLLWEINDHLVVRESYEVSVCGSQRWVVRHNPWESVGWQPVAYGLCLYLC